MSSPAISRILISANRSSTMRDGFTPETSRCGDRSVRLEFAYLIDPNVCHLKNGTLKVLDRKEHIFQMTNTSETFEETNYIAPDKIENIYIQSIYVGQCFVDANLYQVAVTTINLRQSFHLTMTLATTTDFFDRNHYPRRGRHKPVVFGEQYVVERGRGLSQRGN